jgi:RimJ/RimL family protein N-acetyltransferase
MSAADMDPRSYAHSFKLKNGVAITLRAIRPDDRERLRTAFVHLDPGTIYTRFFGAKRELSEAELTAATAIDFDAVVALVADLKSDPETIIGGGRYVRSPKATSIDAEVAFMVEEDYQGLGLASLILRELAAIAKASGVVRFIAEVLPANTAMLQVFRRSGLAMSSRTEDGVVRVALDL